MAEKRRTYEDRVREREDALEKLESNLAESRLAAAQAKPFNPESLADKPIHPSSNKVFMGVGVVIILFLLGSIISALKNQFSSSPTKAKAVLIESATEPATDSLETVDASEKN